MLMPSFSQGFARNAGESANPQLWDKLAGAWVPMLGATGNTVYDFSGNGRHCTLQNMDAGADWTPGRLGYKLDFETSNQYIISDSVNIPFSDTMTLCMLVNRTHGRDTYCFYYSSDTNNRMGMVFGAGLGDEDISFRTRRSGTWRSQSPGSGSIKSRWDSVVGVLDGSNTRIYVNGEDLSVAQGGTIVSGPGGSVYIGGTVSNGFSGSVASVLLYNRALGVNEISQIYLDPLAPFQIQDRLPGFVAPATPTGSIISQMQCGNLGSDLYNGTLI